MHDETEMPRNMPKITDFCDLMPELNGGVLNEMVSRAFAEAANGVTHCDRPKAVAEVTVKFQFRQIGSSMQVEIDHTVSKTIPHYHGKHSDQHTTTTPLFVGTGGKLSINPIKQDDLFKNEQRA